MSPHFFQWWAEKSSVRLSATFVIVYSFHFFQRWSVKSAHRHQCRPTFFDGGLEQSARRPENPFTFFQGRSGKSSVRLSATFVYRLSFIVF